MADAFFRHFGSDANDIVNAQGYFAQHVQRMRPFFIKGAGLVYEAMPHGHIGGLTACQHYGYVPKTSPLLDGRRITGYLHHPIDSLDPYVIDDHMDRLAEVLGSTAFDTVALGNSGTGDDVFDHEIDPSGTTFMLADGIPVEVSGKARAIAELLCDGETVDMIKDEALRKALEFDLTMQDIRDAARPFGVDRLQQVTRELLHFLGICWIEERGILEIHDSNG